MNATDSFSNRARTVMQKCGVTLPDGDGALVVTTPIDGTELARLEPHTAAQIDDAIGSAAQAFERWRDVPAPVRGRLVRRFGDLLVEHKHELAEIVTLEAGKIPSEALGEVQEMIDVCDFAVGLSRQLYGRTMPSERPGHRLMETWHPLGVVGVISAFNFPVAVWSWNTAIALVCGDPVVWKPSETTPLTALACDALLRRAASDVDAPDDLHHVLIGDATTGEALVDDPRVALVSATGSVRMGRIVAPRVAARFGRCLLELGGNNAAIVTPSADLELTVRGSRVRRGRYRRATLHDVAPVDRASLRRGRSGRAPRNRVCRTPGRKPVRRRHARGPTDLAACSRRDALGSRPRRTRRRHPRVGRATGAKCRAMASTSPPPSYACPPRPRWCVRRRSRRSSTCSPTTISTKRSRCTTRVPQGSVVVDLHHRSARGRTVPGRDGSDCGIANVNIGTSGAEIGGAFGGEKETGGGRESGSDSWKAYMRRATNTVNYSDELPLAQGVEFG